MVVLNNLPNNVSNVTHRTGQRYSMIVSGSISIPTETKNMAPNKSLTGFKSPSIFSALVVSAKIEPIINAPSSAEKPTWVAMTTIPKHNPIDRIKRVSSSKNFLALFKKVGNKNIPAMNHRARKNNNFATVKSISAPSNCFVTATVESKTISKITTISSTINTPNTMRAYCLVLIPSSSKAFKMMVVEELASIPPKNKLSITDHPIH